MEKGLFMSVTFQTSVAMETEECCACGVLFAMTREFRQARLDKGPTLTFYCPNGHVQHYTKSRIRELEEQLAAKARELTAARCETLAEKHLREEAERQQAAAQRKLKRTHNGVCPCCNRSFVNLRRHMSTKHPELVGKTRGA
jgi:hypothetical protein